MDQEKIWQRQSLISISIELYHLHIISACLFSSLTYIYEREQLRFAMRCKNSVGQHAMNLCTLENCRCYKRLQNQHFIHFPDPTHLISPVQQNNLFLMRYHERRSNLSPSFVCLSIKVEILQQ